MSEFILIVPPDFIELENATSFVTNYGEDAIRQYVTSREWATFNGILEAFLPPNNIITEVRLIDVANDPENRLRLWYRIQEV